MPPLPAALIKAKLDALDAYESQQRARQPVDAAVLFRNAWGDDPDPWQQEILSSTSKRLFLNCSRQSGKSTVTSVLAVAAALDEPYSLILILSPTDRQSGLLFRKCKRVYECTPTLPALIKCNERSMVLPNGSEIVSLPGKPDNIRGYSAPRIVIIDEAAFAPDQLYRAVRPMLAVSQGMLALLSSPFGKRGFYFEEYEHIQDMLKGKTKFIDEDEEEDEDETPEPWHYIEVPATMVPRIKKKFLREEQRSLGPFYQQEYFCKFLDNETAIFDYDSIQAALDRGEEVERWI